MRLKVRSAERPFAWLVMGIFLFVNAHGQTSGGKGTVITLQEAASLVQQHNPSLHALREQHQAAKRRLEQAFTFSNPEIELEAENLEATGSLRSENGVQYSARIKKNFWFWGRYRSEVALALADTSQSYLSWQKGRLAADSQAKTTYLEVWLAQEGLKLAKRNDSLSQESHEHARIRVSAGMVSPIDSIRTGMRKIEAELNMEQAENELRQAIRTMENTWGGSNTAIMGIATAPPMPAKVLPLQFWQKMLTQSPDWKQAELEAFKLQLNVTLEKTQRLPGFEISGGIKTLESGDGHAWTGEFSIPLPLLNWNSSGIASAHRDWKAGQSQLKAVQLELEENFLKTHAQAILFEKKYIAAKDKLLPAARAAYNTTLEGYKAGKHSGQMLLDAGKEWLEIEHRFLKTTKQFYMAVTKLAQMAGGWPTKELYKEEKENE